jgi:hypothetical protein
MIKTEVFASFAVPTEPDDAYEKVAVENVTGRRATPYSPARVVEEKIFRIHKSILATRWPNWQQGVSEWAAAANEPQPPVEFAEDIHNPATAANLPQIVISNPLTLTGIPSDERTVDIEVEISSEGIEKAWHPASMKELQMTSKHRVDVKEKIQGLQFCHG